MNKFEQSLLSSLTSAQNANVVGLSYDYKSIFVSQVRPDESNPRYFPAVIMSDNHAYQMATRKITKQQLIEIYSAQGKVVVGKACIVNCCATGSVEWKRCNQMIASVIELGENIAVSEIIQAPTVYPVEDGFYQILTGHRRFFALIYAHGVAGAAHFKVYQEKPLLYKVKQFQENASREDLSQYGKLDAFQTAMQEIEIYNRAKKRLGDKPMTVREIIATLGISGGAFDNYNVLTRYPAVVKVYEEGNTVPFVKMKRTILEVEQRYKDEHNVKVLTGTHKSDINKKLTELLNSGKQPQLRKQLKYSFDKIESPKTLKRLLSSNIFELNTGVDWEKVNWEDSTAVNKALKTVLKHLSEVTG